MEVLVFELSFHLFESFSSLVFEFLVSEFSPVITTVSKLHLGFIGVVSEVLREGTDLRWVYSRKELVWLLLLSIVVIIFRIVVLGLGFLGWFGVFWLGNWFLLFFGLF